MVCLLFLPFALSMAETASLYSFDVPVKGQSKAERSEAIRKALVGVLVNVSGNPEIETSGRFDAIYARASTFVLRYRYLPLIDEQLWEEGYRQMLRVDFDEDSVLRLLRESEFAASGGAALTTLVSLTVTKVSSIEDYAAVIDYLKSLHEVTRVQVEEVDPVKIVLRLEIQGDIMGLEHAIDEGNLLVSAAQPRFDGYGVSSELSGKDAELIYRLIE